MTAGPKSGAPIEAAPNPEAVQTERREYRGRAVLRGLELVLVIVSLGYALVFWLRLPGQLPSEQDYQALEAFLQKSAQPGDAVAVLPFWADRAKIYVHGLPVLALPQLENEPDLERYLRLWVVAQPHLPRSDARASLEKIARKLTRVGPATSFGPLELSLFTPREGRAATFDFLAQFADAQLDSPGPVRPEWREFDYLPRRCLLARAGQATLRFNAIPIPHGIRLGLGNLVPGGGAEMNERILNPTGFPPGSRLQVSIDGQPLPPFEPVPKGPTFQTTELPAQVPPGDHQVELTISGRGVCADAVAF